MPYKIAHLNIRGTGDTPTNANILISYMKKNKIDFLSLSETKTTTRNLPFFFSDNITTHPNQHPSKQALKGVITLISPSLSSHLVSQTNIIPGHCTKSTFKIQDNNLNIFSLYGPNDPNVIPFLDQILNDKYLDNNENNIFIGDWNLLQDIEIDRNTNTKYPKITSTNKLTQIKEEYSLVDPWRQSNPSDTLAPWKDTGTYSWSSNPKNPNHPIKKSRIDYALTNDYLYPLITSTEYLPSPIGTDHKMLLLTVNFDSYKKGPGYFRVKNDLYNDPEFTEKVKEMILSTLNQYSTTPSATCPKVQYFKPPEDILTIIIFMVRNIAIQHTQLCHKNKSETFANLKHEIQHTQNLIDSTPGPQEDLTLKLEKLKLEQKEYLDSISQNDYMEKLQYDYLNQQRPGKDFPKPSIYKPITFSEHFTTVNDKPLLIKNQKATETHIHNFYKDLFAHKPCSDDPSSVKKFLGNISLTQVTKEENLSLGAPIQLPEVASFLKTMSNHKAPGFTGVTPAFYKFFWPQIKNITLDSITSCLEKGILPSSQRCGMVTLIPKQDKDTRYVGNLRPITLLSTFYKIISGTLTERLKPTLNRIINDWQKAYLPNRYIGNVTRNTFDMFHYAKQNNIPGLMLQLDFSKAFDSISFQYIESTLKLFGFCDTIIHWISTLLHNFSSVTMPNGNISPQIPVGRGCRQGDPIAGYLFIICIEILLLRIHNNPNIHPWKSKHGNSNLIDAYADDINLFIQSPNAIPQLQEILKIMEQFQQISGLEINVDKTKYALFGNAQNDPNITLQTALKLENDPFRLLGIHLTGNLDQLEINWTMALKSAKAEIVAWNLKRSTPHGKANIVKSNVLSKFTHIAMALPTPPKSFILQLESLITSFIAGKRHKYPKSLIFTPTDLGGLGVPDIQAFWSSLQCSWLKRMYGKNHFWLRLLSENHPHNPCETLLHPKSLVSSMFKKSSSPFWLNIHKSWDKIYTHQLASNPNLRLIENLQTQTHHRRRKTSHPPYNAQISLAQITNPPTLQQRSLPLASIDHLKGTFPKINICSMMALQKDTQKLRENTLPQINYHPGNYFPFINAQTVIIQPNKKGCKYIYNMINPKVFNPKDWSCIDKLNALFPNTPTFPMEPHIKSLNKTSPLPWANNLQLLTLRNNNLNNRKLHLYKKRDSPNCDLCQHPVQDNLHRFYSCPHVRPVWNMLSNMLNAIGILEIVTPANALMNFPDQQPSSFLIIITNFFRHEIDKSHINHRPLTPITILAKTLTLASIMMNHAPIDKNTWLALFCNIKINPTTSTFINPNQYNAIMTSSQIRTHPTNNLPITFLKNTSNTS